MGQRKARQIVEQLGGRCVTRYSWPFTTVVAVDLVHRRADNTDLAEFASLRDLETLDLQGTGITDEGLQALRGLTRLAELSLESTAVTDAGIRWLAGLTALRKLNLSRTQVSDAGLSQLAGLTALTTLFLVETPVTDAGMVALTKLPRLAELGLMTTRVGDKGLLALANAPGLQTVYMSGTAMTLTGVQRFQSLRPRVWLVGALDLEQEPQGSAEPPVELPPAKLTAEDELLAERLNRLFAAANSLRGRNPRGHESASNQLAEIHASLLATPERLARVVARARELSHGAFDWPDE